MHESVFDILERLEAARGSNAKKEILHENAANELLKRTFVAAQDPYVSYYVSKFNASSTSTDTESSSDETLEVFLEVLSTRFATREVTGNAAKEWLKKLFSTMTLKEQKWCQRILLRNLRVGVQESTLEKVWPGAVRSFSVALAQTLKSEFERGRGITITDTVSYPVRVEPKLDGLRCIAVKKAGVVTFFTRNGREIDTLPGIKSVLAAATYDDIVLDGEIMGADWSESASVVMSRKTRKDDARMHYNVFDAMAVSDWIAQESMTPYSTRCLVVSDVVRACSNVGGGDRVRQVPHITVHNEDELRAFFSKCLDEGYEGIMLKTIDTPYRWDRSKNILKLKPCVTYEGMIVGHYCGRRGTKHEGRFGGFNVVLPNGVVTRVGGGFNDAVRSQVELEGPGTWVGRIAECEAQPDPMTKDGLTVDGKMRFPVFTRIRDRSDVDPAVTEAGTTYLADLASNPVEPT